MSVKPLLIHSLVLVLICIFSFSVLTGCANSNIPGGAADSSSNSPDDTEEPVVISRGDDVVQSPSDSGDAPGGGGPDWEPKPADSQLDEGEVFITQSDILIMESYPPQFALLISGALPSPCHALRVEVEEPDEENQVVVNLYSVVDPQEVCVQVLEEFDANVPLGTPPPGTYQVILNGEEIGEIGYE